MFTFVIAAVRAPIWLLGSISAWTEDAAADETTGEIDLADDAATLATLAALDAAVDETIDDADDDSSLPLEEDDASLSTTRLRTGGNSSIDMVS